MVKALRKLADGEIATRLDIIEDLLDGLTYFLIDRIGCGRVDAGL